MFAEIAVNSKSSRRDDLFTYLVPPEIEGDIVVGQMVIVPLANRKVNGVVIALHSTKPKFETKAIDKIVEPVPVVDKKMIELARFISEYYWCGFSQALFTMLPANLRKRKTRIFKQEIKNQKSKVKNVESLRDDIVSNISDLVLTFQQEKALGKIVGALEKNKPATLLLHGVTNSGKTEVYLRSFAKVLESGGSGIYIVPEIALTPQGLKRFEEVFGKDRVALVHSQMTIAQRLKTWVDIKTGKKRVVVGSRSAIFAPVENLKLVVIDEEHDLISFKSDQTPRYELHTLAEKLAGLTNSVLIFGSATPLVTSYKRVIDGDWEYLSMPERIGGGIAPMVKIVDMEETKPKGGDGIFSEYLLEALGLVLKNKKQALLFLNRRGMASFIICETCKKVSMCESCDSALVYHSIDNRLWCHHCGRKYPVPVRCDICGGLDFRFLGKGTEKIESEIKKYFPDARIARMDRDTMISDQAYQGIFDRFKAGEIDILVGTQMIVHGWDIPAVDLAAVISIDESLLIPDYASEEKVFQLITQLAGRTGRSDARGMLVLQTHNPDLPVFETAVKNDYLSFAKRELALREKFGYPPFGRIVKLSFGGVNKGVVEKKAEELKKSLDIKILDIAGEAGLDIDIIGPIAPLIEKKYGRYWKNIIIKSKLPATSYQLLDIVPKDWVIDIDPISFL